jgi:hypothetical protein
MRRSSTAIMVSIDELFTGRFLNGAKTPTGYGGGGGGNAISRREGGRTESWVTLSREMRVLPGFSSGSAYDTRYKMEYHQ